jgi:hypothetical protein
VSEVPDRGQEPPERYDESGGRDSGPAPWQSPPTERVDQGHLASTARDHWQPAADPWAPQPKSYSTESYGTQSYGTAAGSDDPMLDETPTIVQRPAGQGGSQAFPAPAGSRGADQHGGSDDVDQGAFDGSADADRWASGQRGGSADTERRGFDAPVGSGDAGRWTTGDRGGQVGVAQPPSSAPDQRVPTQAGVGSSPRPGHEQRFSSEAGAAPAQRPAVTSSDDPLFPGDRPSWQPRIIPSPPPPPGRLLRRLLIGLLAGLVAFGTGGYFVGRWTAASSPATSPTAAPNVPGPGPSASLPPYEQSQLQLNRPKFSGDLATLAEPWLPWVSGCRKNGERDGPQLQPGEAVRITCEYGIMRLTFLEYKSAVDRDKTRIRHLAENLDARQLTTGVAGGVDRRATPSGRTEGGYIEYAYRTRDAGPPRTVCGLWWDVADKPVAAYLLTFWTEGLGESWEPMRDVWGRYA